ncbi:MAG: SH3 domain-containing protein [Armatimonadetes bacterium]|nr:SH3 domain-containing protein [Armatimonadota bacterium]
MHCFHRWVLPIYATALASLSLFRLQPLEAKSYQVHSGDSLWTIAREFDTHVATLCQLNGLTEKSALQLGQQIQLPDTANTSKSSVVSLKHSASFVGYINSPRVSVRSAPGSDKNRVAMATQGSAVRVLGSKAVAIGPNSLWYQIRFSNGKQGWVRADLVTVGQAAASVGSQKAVSTPARVSQINRVAYIGEDIVNVRKAPGTGSPRLAKALKGTTVRLVAKSEDWYKVKFPNGTRGWIHASLVTQGNSTRGVLVNLGKGPRAYALKDGINLRQGPGREHDRIAKVTKGAAMKICAKRGDWYKVRCTNGQTGWIAGFLVKEVRFSARKAATVRRGFARMGRRMRRFNLREVHIPGLHPFVRSALKYRGARYVRGGSIPSRGFDCSGLVYRVLNNNGVSAPRTSSDQYHVGAPVSKEQMKPGDLVFFKNTYRRGVSHVGIYMGNGKFVHAANRRKGVTVTDLDQGFYRKKFAGARRIK